MQASLIWQLRPDISGCVVSLVVTIIVLSQSIWINQIIRFKSFSPILLHGKAKIFKMNFIALEKPQKVLQRKKRQACVFKEGHVVA